ncbi:hypothetical protein JK358_34260 [Nocardia sp. 2]|uniref:Uncharacterized protein n=1 Tax=Nocardia acididurans TaxID=2802282 RepID=A0ABS1MFQ1_9NOCA|nr:hypothetical protein [Nocardia acididurans]MBL1079482.1 hypothetical protein [Nocardia acididurans]
MIMPKTSLRPGAMPDFITEATAIDDAREAAFAGLRAANARGLTGADADAFAAAMSEVDARCERLRQRFYPRRHRLFIVHGAAMVVSPTFRSREIVWRRPRVTEDGDAK